MFGKKRDTQEEIYRREWASRPEWIIVHLRHGGYAVRKKVRKPVYIPGLMTFPRTIYEYIDVHSCRDRRAADRWLKAELAGDRIVYPEPPQ